MTLRHRTLLLAAPAVAFMLAACGGGAAPAGSAPATTTTGGAPPTASPAGTVTGSPAAPTGGEPSGVHGATDLEALFPQQVAGQPLEVQSMSADQFLGIIGNDPQDVAEFESFVGALGRSTSDVSVAFGAVTLDQTDVVSVSALQVRGADPAALLTAFGTFLQQSEAEDGATMNLGQETVGGKSVTVVAPAGGDENDAIYVYGRGDVVFEVRGASRAQANEILTALP